MYKRMTMLIAAVIGLSFGVSFGPSIWQILHVSTPWLENIYLNGLLFGIIFMLMGSALTPVFTRVIRQTQEILNKQAATTILFGTIGGVSGLIVGYLISLPFSNLNIPLISTAIPLVLSLILAVIGYQTATSREDEWRSLFLRSSHQRREKKHAVEGQVLDRKAGENFRKYKLLDTSVIIDGRIADIVREGFIEGVLVIPNFVLQELQYIADSSDALKRAKGRRGLDILNAMQKEAIVPIEIYDGDFEEVAEVDSKLIRLAKLIDAAIVTNDYNLNKVCEFQNVKVFNINALANAVKPVVIPGEVLEVAVIKPGTERKQGVAYLEDGTMIVVEDGQYYMNELLRVVVTSALQTAAGRMIFAKPLHSQDKIETKSTDDRD